MELWIAIGSLALAMIAQSAILGYKWGKSCEKLNQVYGALYDRDNDSKLSDLKSDVNMLQRTVDNGLVRKVSIVNRRLDRLERQMAESQVSLGYTNEEMFKGETDNKEETNGD